MLQRQRNSVFDRLNDPSLDFSRALQSRPICRFETFRQTVGACHANGDNTSKSVDVVLDIAHNADAVRTLMEKVRLLYGDEVPVR